MLTDAQVYCMTSMIYLFRPPLTAKPFIGKRRKQSCTPNTFPHLIVSQVISCKTQSVTCNLFTIHVYIVEFKLFDMVFLNIGNEKDYESMIFNFPDCLT